MNIEPTLYSEPTFRDHYRSFRKWLLAFTPFVKRKRYRKLERELIELRMMRGKSISSLLMALPAHRAINSRCYQAAPLSQAIVEELCLFVSFAPQSQLKPHVLDHIQALLAQGIQVLLIINTDLEPSQFNLPEKFTAQLYGLMIRQNEGFDFAAWAHAFAMLNPESIRKRLYLVNDSIVGPLESKAYATMISLVRNTQADFLGLTENAMPCWHLQSFFLVINSELLHSATWKTFMESVLNMPTKQDAIDYYETQLTQYLVQAGFDCKAVFQYLAPNEHLCNDTVFNWVKLIEIGFPFVKASVLHQSNDTPEAKRLVPSRYRDVSSKNGSDQASLESR